MRSHTHRARCAIGVALLALIVAHPSSAQRGPRADKPTGAEIALKARSARLDRANAGKGEFQGKPITFTPALLAPRADLAGGQVIGVLENEVTGDETGLPPGKYNVFAARLEDGWHVYAEANGEVVREALRVELVRRPGQAAEKKPRIRAKGWGVDIDYTPERTFNPPPVASIAIVGDQKQLLIGEQRQFTVELKDGAGNVLTGRSVTWASSAPGVASTPSLGVAKGIAGGSATLTATSEGKSASVTLSVPTPVYKISFGDRNVNEYTWTRPAATAQTLTVYIDVIGCYYTGGGCPVANPAEVTITSSAPTVASMTSFGGTARTTYTQLALQLKVLAEGRTDISLSARGATMVLHLTAVRANTASLVVTPAALKVVAGQSQQLTATARDANGGVLATPITWSSSESSIADITSSGRVAGVSIGTATISAKSDAVVTTVPVEVAPVPVATVTVTPAPVSVEENAWTALAATLKDQAGNVLTGRNVIWTVNNAALAEVTSSGRVIGVAPGTVMVTATSEGRSGTAAVTVTAPPATADRPTETISFNW